MKLLHTVAAVSAMSIWIGSAFASAQRGGAVPEAHEVSPHYRVVPRVRDHPRHAPAVLGSEAFRSIDGRGNHPVHVDDNAAYTPLLRTMAPDYADDVSAMAGETRPGAREVSNLVHDQTELVPNPYGTSDYLWQWGQFLDHDIDLTQGVAPPEAADISAPQGDPYFDPANTGAAVIRFNRSLYDHESGTDPENPRQQMNEVTGWIDASNVYGSDPVRAAALRTNDGTGRLRTGPGNLLPDSDGTLPNATGGSSQVMFLAGDVRANEQVGLTALHTLFVREHNRLADKIRRKKPRLDGDAIYERARRLVGATMQAITYEEFLPALLGRRAIGRYRGYDPDVDARIANEFSTAAYRLGHSALPPRLLRLDERLRATAAGHVALRDAFFNPDRIRNQGGIEPLLRGLAYQQHQRIDVFVIDDVRNFLFGPPGAGGFDLAALNIQRGRDHGLASYNDAREAYGLPRVVDFAQIHRDPEVQARLAAAYRSVDDIDMWVGGLAEEPVAPSQVGPLNHAILVEQFTALRDGDRFWYERILGSGDRKRVRRTRLVDVIRRNTEIGREIPEKVFWIREGRGRFVDVETQAVPHERARE